MSNLRPYEKMGHIIIRLVFNHEYEHPHINFIFLFLFSPTVNDKLKLKPNCRVTFIVPIHALHANL